jgi:hypothetical protein
MNARSARPHRLGVLRANAIFTVFAFENGLDLGAYRGQWGSSLPSAHLAADLGIASVAFVFWAAWEGRRVGMRTWWVPIPASALVGLCFAAPLFLLLRERALGSAGMPGYGPAHRHLLASR